VYGNAAGVMKMCGSSEFVTAVTWGMLVVLMPSAAEVMDFGESGLSHRQSAAHYVHGRKYSHRNIYCVVAVDICRFCPSRIVLFRSFDDSGWLWGL